MAAAAACALADQYRPGDGSRRVERARGTANAAADIAPPPVTATASTTTAAAASAAAAAETTLHTRV